MLHRIVTRLATLLLVAGLLAAPAAASAKRHHKRHARHHLVKLHRAATKSAGRSETTTSNEPPRSDPAPPQEPEQGDQPATPTPPPVQSSDAGVVASYDEGVLDVELTTDGHVTGRVIPGGTQFTCRSASTNEPVTEGCDASLLHAGQHVHEFTVNYGPNGAWFARIIVLLP